MTRNELKRFYYLLVLLALAVGFALGYLCRGKRSAPPDPERAFRPDVAESAACLRPYDRLCRSVATGEPERIDFGEELKELKRLQERHPDCQLLSALSAQLHELWALRLKRGCPESDVALIGGQLGYGADASRESMKTYCTNKALSIWKAIASSKVATDQSPSGRLWRLVCAQNMAAIEDRKRISVGVLSGGQVDLAPAFNVRSVTRRNVRYVPDCGWRPGAPTFAENLLPDFFPAPREEAVRFDFPCVRHIPGGSAGRRYVSVLRTGLEARSQFLELPPTFCRKIHFLAYHVSPAERTLSFPLMLVYEGGKETPARLPVAPMFKGQKRGPEEQPEPLCRVAFRFEQLQHSSGETVDYTETPAFLYHSWTSADTTARLTGIQLPPLPSGFPTPVTEPPAEGLVVLAMTLELVSK